MPESTDVDGEQVLGIEQEVATLRAAIARLNPEQRDLVQKAYLGELTHSEIQAQTGLPLGTIKSRIRLGLERLRHELKGAR
ncbi:MAG: RNA polymerase sigma-70 factor (ECF subfamily) [Celeribacter sp.]|jgi:RNA polymerase sigma-70 factor (ECF subfamily)